MYVQKMRAMMAKILRMKLEIRLPEHAPPKRNAEGSAPRTPASQRSVTG
jgi:hypothetical protein